MSRRIVIRRGRLEPIPTVFTPPMGTVWFSRLKTGTYFIYKELLYLKMGATCAYSLTHEAICNFGKDCPVDTVTIRTGTPSPRIRR